MTRERRIQHPRTIYRVTCHGGRRRVRRNAVRVTILLLSLSGFCLKPGLVLGKAESENTAPDPHISRAGRLSPFHSGHETCGLSPIPGALLRLETIPPSPVTKQVVVDIRGAVTNTTDKPQTWQVKLYLDSVAKTNELRHTRVEVEPESASGVRFHWPPRGHPGQRNLLLVARCGTQTRRASVSLRVLASASRSTGRLEGAWCDIYHWSETEGRFYNPALKRMTDRDWRGLVRAMHEIGLNVVVLGEAFRNQVYVGQHLELSDYHGRGYYPSRLYPGRMPMATQDPFAAILSEADRLGMHVFMPLGLYAWFDYSPASLEWHERVASELWKLYGQHPSFYGWYVTEEIAGNLGTNKTRREQIVRFFETLTPCLHRLAPEKPVMLASNCHSIREGLAFYPQLLPNLDILCPFGFDRMPAGDMSGGQAAALLQQLCDKAGTHLWMDLEVFHFDSSGALAPRPIDEIVQTLRHYPNFEETLCYEFTGLMTAPWMSPQLGGPRAVRLYRDYQREPSIEPPH